MGFPLASINIKPFVQPRNKNIIFEDNCTDGFYTWTKLSSSGTWNTSREGFVYAGGAIAGAKLYMPNFYAKNAYMEADVSIDNVAGDLYGGIILRNNNTTTGGYLFRLQRVSATYSWRMENQGITVLQDGSFNWSENKWYRLGISVIGIKIEGYIDGIKVVTLNNTAVTNQNPALFGFATSTCKFRNVKIIKA